MYWVLGWWLGCIGFVVIVVVVENLVVAGFGAVYFQFWGFGGFGLARLLLVVRIAWCLLVLGFGVI